MMRFYLFKSALKYKDKKALCISKCFEKNILIRFRSNKSGKAMFMEDGNRPTHSISWPCADEWK
ncbi:MAG TPA: hypothetical protein VFL47_13550, partial [Flavisolibacter sp.]|nr:hypothetical protein [Flavisolibacter sp.]